MSRLRWQLRTYIVGVIAAGATAVALAAFGPRVSASEDLVVIAILLGLATVAQVWPVHLSLKVKLTVDDTPLFAAALLLGPFVSILVSAVSALVGLHIRNAKMPWYNRAFTAAVSALATGAAATAYGQPLALVLFAVPMVAMLIMLRDSARVREQTRAAILELADLIDLRDPYTHGHSQRVAALAERIARRLKLQYSQVELIRDAARVHDIGKIGTNDLVLLKAGPLDPNEQEEMRRHVEIG